MNRRICEMNAYFRMLYEKEKGGGEKEKLFSITGRVS